MGGIDFHRLLFRDYSHWQESCIRCGFSVQFRNTAINMRSFETNTGRVLRVLELAGRFTCTWPNDPNSSKREIVLRNVRWSFTMLNVILLLISLVLAIFYFRDDIGSLMKTTSELTVLLEVFLDLILCKMKAKELQILIGKVQAFLKVASKREIAIIQGYTNRYKVFFFTIAVLYIVTAITFSLAPLFTAQELPADGWIPFSTESRGVYYLAYIIQVYCIILTAFCIGVDFTIAVLFSFPAAKLDILGTRLREVNSFDMLVSCVKEHQEIVGFVEDTKATVEALLFKTNATMGSAVMCGAFPLIYNQSLAVISQFLPLIIGGCGRLYVISWPADDLRESSSRFAKSIANIHWMGKPRRMTNIVIIMMQRSQKTLLIRMSDLLPALSLEYYAKFLTSVSSYFMGMRTMIES